MTTMIPTLIQTDNKARTVKTRSGTRSCPFVNINNYNHFSISQIISNNLIDTSISPDKLFLIIIVRPYSYNI